MEDILDYISDMSFKLEETNTLVLCESSHFDVTAIIKNSTKSTVLVSSSGANKLRDLQKIDLFILIFLSVQKFAQWLKEVYWYKFFNPRGKFIIHIVEQKSMSEIFEIAWRYYVTNINLICLKDNILGAYTYYPYKSCPGDIAPNLLCLHPEIPEMLFPEKIPIKFDGCKLNLGAVYIEPFASRSNIFEDPKQSGFEVTMIDTISKHLNLVPIFLKHNFTFWGTKLPNGSYSNLFGSLERREVDIVFGGSYLSPDCADFEILCWVTMDNIMWWVPSAKLRDPWANHIYVYTPSLWRLLVTSILVNGIVWWLFGKNKEKYVMYNYLPESIIASLYVYLQGGVASPKSTFLRILVALWLLFSLILYTAHQSQLVSTLTGPKYDKQISTIQEVIETMPVGFIPPGIGYFQNPTDPIDAKIRKKWYPCALDDGCLNRTAFLRDFATLRSESQALVLVSRLYLSHEGRPLLYSFKSGLKLMSRYFLDKGNPLIQKINPILSNLVSGGLMQKWISETTYVKKVPDESKLTILTLKHLAVGFLYLFCGLILSTIVFIFEVIGGSVKKTCKTYS